MSYFKGKTVIVTGASSGIGEATAKEFLLQGAKVILVSRSESKMRDSFKDFNQNSYSIHSFDLNKLDEIETFVNELVENEGPIDILFNNAGIGSQSLFKDTDLQVFHDIMHLDYFSVVYFTKAIMKHMIKQKNGPDALLVTYISGGNTPGDSYLWQLDEQGIPISFKMWVQIIPVHGISASWEQWITTESGAKLAGFHKLLFLDIIISSIQARK